MSCSSTAHRMPSDEHAGGRGPVRARTRESDPMLHRGGLGSDSGPGIARGAGYASAQFRGENMVVANGHDDAVEVSKSRERGG